MHLRRTVATLACPLALIAFPSCKDSRPSATPSTPAAVEPRVSGTRDDGDLRRRQMAFLNHIREADPQERTIDRAMLNEQNELGLILDRTVEMDKVPALMKTMLTRMAKEFPGQDLTVIAYTPSEPPHKIGTGRLNARTRDLTYTAER